MSSAEDQLTKLGYRLVELKSAKDLVQAKLNAKLDDLCSGEVSQDWAADLFQSEDKKSLKAYKLVKIGDAKMTAGILMYVSPMRAYSGDVYADLFAQNAKKIGFDQAKQNGDAAELLVFCVEKSSRGKEKGSLANLLLLHAIEDSKKKFIVIGQQLGAQHERASTFYNKLFDKKFEGDKDGGKFNFYVGSSEDVAAKLRGIDTPEKKPAASKKPAKKPAASKKPKVAVASATGKRRRAAKICGKTVKRNESFLNSVGKLFKIMRDEHVKVDSTLSMRAACTIDAILRDSLERIGANINSLLSSKHSKTVNISTVEKAIALTFGRPNNNVKNLPYLMLSDGDQAVATYNRNVKLSKKQSRAARAGLTIAPARVVRLLRESRVAQRFAKFADIHLAAALQTLATDLIEGSLQMIKDSKLGKGRLSPRVVMLWVQGDDELRKVIRGTFGSAGVMPMQEFAKKPKKQ